MVDRDRLPGRDGTPAGSAALDELEQAMALCLNSLHRCMTRCMASAGRAGMSPLEIFILQEAEAHGLPRRFADLCLSLGIEDQHQAHYAIRKLVAAGLLRQGRDGKEKTVAATPEGHALCLRYRAVRQQSLDPLRQGQADGLPGMAALLRDLSGLYDHAARAASTW